MKKIIALVVAVLMMAAIAVPAFAAWDTEFNTVGAGNTTEVTFGVDEGYTVKIPQKVDFGTALTTSIQISASGVKIAGNASLRVKVASLNYSKGTNEEATTDDTWQLIDTNTHEEEGVQVPNSANVPYMITVDGANVVSGSTVVLEVDSADELTTPDDVTSGTKGSATLTFTTDGTSQVGKYKDTLTFSAEVVK